MSNPYTGGIPDCWYSGNTGDLWVEYKWGSNSLSALQKDWIQKRRAEGRRVWVVTGNKLGGTVDPFGAGPSQYTKAEIAELIAEATIESNTKIKKSSRRK